MPTLRSLLLAAAFGLVAAAAQAQFAMVPAPLITEPPRASEAEIEKEYRVDAAKHIYAAYPMRVFRGKLPPLLYSVMMVETEIDATGQVLNVNVVRKPRPTRWRPGWWRWSSAPRPTRHRRR